MNSDELQSAACPVTGSAATSLARATLADPQVLAHPGAFYDAMRAEDPVHFDPVLQMYLVSRYEDLQTVLRDPVTFSAQQGVEQQQQQGGFGDEYRAILERDGFGVVPNVIMTDPPHHARIRKLTEKAFTAHRVKKLEESITGIAIERIERLADKGHCDGVRDFAVPMTIQVICEQLGISHFDADKIQRWSIAATAQIGRMSSREQMLEHAKEMCEQQNYLVALIRERQAAPREDMISDLIHNSLEDGSSLTFPELMSIVSALLTAGNETTTTALGNLLFILATKPELAKQLAEAVDDDRLFNRFVEELLRIEPPVRGMPRATTKEVQLGGKTLPAGAHLLLLFASGNDDEGTFACPRQFDMNRSNLGSHVSFGAGPHRCVGSALARMEIKVAAREIVRRLDNIQLAIDVADIKYLPTVATRSIASLPITYTRRL